MEVVGIAEGTLLATVVPLMVGEVVVVRTVAQWEQHQALGMDTRHPCHSRVQWAIPSTVALQAPWVAGVVSLDMAPQLVSSSTSLQSGERTNPSLFIP